MRMSTEDSTTWEPLPGWILFGLLLFTAINLLPPSGDHGDLSHGAESWLRLSPFTSLYDICQRMIEIGILVAQRLWRLDIGADNDGAIDILVHLGSSVHNAQACTTLRCASVALAILALFSLKHVSGTKLIVALQLARWLFTQTFSVLRRSRRSGFTDQTLHRWTSMLFMATCHYILTTGAPFTRREEVLSITLLFFAVGMGYVGADGVDQSPNTIGLIIQLPVLLGTGFIFLLAWGPVPPTTAGRDRHEAMSRLEIAALAHLFTVVFVMSRRTLKLAHPAIKAIVGTAWLALAAFYYCYYYKVYIAYHMPTAQRPSLTTDWMAQMIRLLGDRL